MAVTGSSQKQHPSRELLRFFVDLGATVSKTSVPGAVTSAGYDLLFLFSWPVSEEPVASPARFLPGKAAGCRQDSSKAISLPAWKTGAERKLLHLPDFRKVNLT